MKLAGIPEGTGSLQKRGRTWWMIYPDKTGRMVTENSYTSHWDTALQLLALRTVELAEERARTLREIASGKRFSNSSDGPQNHSEAHPQRTDEHASDERSASTEWYGWGLRIGQATFTCPRPGARDFRTVDKQYFCPNDEDWALLMNMAIDEARDARSYEEIDRANREELAKDYPDLELKPLAPERQTLQNAYRDQVKPIVARYDAARRANPDKDWQFEPGTPWRELIEMLFPVTKDYMAAIEAHKAKHVQEKQQAAYEEEARQRREARRKRKMEKTMLPQDENALKLYIQFDGRVRFGVLASRRISDFSFIEVKRTGNKLLLTPTNKESTERIPRRKMLRFLGQKFDPRTPRLEDDPRGRLFIRAHELCRPPDLGGGHNSVNVIGKPVGDGAIEVTF